MPAAEATFEMGLSCLKSWNGCFHFQNFLGQTGAVTSMPPEHRHTCLTSGSSMQPNPAGFMLVLSQLFGQCAECPYWGCSIWQKAWMCQLSSVEHTRVRPCNAEWSLQYLQKFEWLILYSTTSVLFPEFIPGYLALHGGNQTLYIIICS